MFYYFGRKKRLAGLYPEPLHDTIIEPFVGSGAYSLHGDRWQRDVRINDLDERVIGLWHYLQQASSADILALPVPQPGELLSSYALLSDEERLLVSLHIGPGKNRSNDVVSKFSRWPAGQRYVAQTVDKVRHWTITHGSYSDIPDADATWFVDPPYQRSGRLYRHHDIDFPHLSEWVKERTGQVVVCEQDGADWLPFTPLATIAIAGKHFSKETVWVR